MINYKYGEIVLVTFSYPETGQKKKRPALVIFDSGDDDLVLSPITTRMRNLPGDCILAHWQFANLLKPSMVRLGKVNTLDKTAIERKLGELDEIDKLAVSKMWNEIYKLSS